MNYLKKAFLYLTKHETIAVAILTVIVTIIGFLFKNIIYLKEHVYLSYWNIDNYYINLEDNQLYSFVWSVFLSLVMFLIIVLFDNVSSTYSNYYRYIKEQKYYLNLLKINCSKNRRETKKFIRNLDKYKFNSIDFDKIINLGIEGDEKYDDFIYLKNQLKKDIKNCHKKNFLCLFIYVLAAFFVFVLVLIPVFTPFVNTFFEMVLSFLVILMYLLFILFIMIELKNKKSRKLAKNKAKQRFEQRLNADFHNEQCEKYSDEENSADFLEEYFLLKLYNKGIIEIIKSFNYKKLLNTFGLIIVIIIISSIILGFFQAKDKKSFEVYEYDGRNFAIVYCNKENAIAKEFIIYDDNCTIDVDNQVVQNVNALETKYYKFKEVNLIGNHKSSINQIKEILKETSRN